jgi:hypothetical protein
MFFSQMGHLMPITYLPLTSQFTYLPTHPPTYILPTYLPTHLPRCSTYLPTYSPINNLPTHSPISYNLLIYVTHNLVMMCQNKHVK